MLIVVIIHLIWSFAGSSFLSIFCSWRPDTGQVWATSMSDLKIRCCSRRRIAKVSFRDIIPVVFGTDFTTIIPPGERRRRVIFSHATGLNPCTLCTHAILFHPPPYGMIPLLLGLRRMAEFPASTTNTMTKLVDRSSK